MTPYAGFKTSKSVWALSRVIRLQKPGQSFFFHQNSTPPPSTHEAIIIIESDVGSIVYLQGSRRVGGLLCGGRYLHVHSERSKRCGGHPQLYLLERPSLPFEGENITKL